MSGPSLWLSRQSETRETAQRFGDTLDDRGGAAGDNLDYAGQLWDGWET
jgi:hypothetical protein